jgi:hypothetical protein
MIIASPRQDVGVRREAFVHAFLVLEPNAEVLPEHREAHLVAAEKVV